MERKLNLKKMASVLLTLMVTISMIMPSMLVPKEVSAESQTFTPQMATQMKSYVGQSMTCDAYAAIVGRSIFGYSSFPGYYAPNQENWLKQNAEYVGSTTEPATFPAKDGDIFVTNGGTHIGFFLEGNVIHGGIFGKVSFTDISYWWDYSKNIYGQSGAGAASISVYRVFKDEGYAKLKKTTKSNKHLTDLCPEQYSIAGATYGVYADSACTSAVSSFVTDESGNSNVVKLKPTVHYVKETKAPKGYKLDPTVYTLDVKAGETTVLNVADEPLLDPFKLKLVKKAEEGADKNLTLEGAEYTVKYYKDFLNKEEVKTATPFRTWVFSTKRITNDVYGFLLSDKYKVGGDEFFRNEKGNPVGLRGTYVVEEIKAPKGFAKTDGIVALRHFNDSEHFGGIDDENELIITDIEKTQKVNIKIQKKDAETGETKPQGYGSFAGAKFNVWMYDPLQLMDVLVGTIVTNENGTGELVKLAPGLYTIEEIEAPAGYNKNTEKVKIEARVKEINTAYFDYLATIAEKPITVTARKTSFDEVGAVVPVKGAVLALYNSKDEKIEEWTTTGKVHTFKGLAKGKYVIKELVTPKGYLPLENDYHFTVEETEKIQEQDVFNEPIPEIKSIATFDTGVKESLPKEEVTVNDKFELKKLRRDFPYELRTKLVEKDNISNVIAEKSHEFFASDYSQEVDLEYTFNAKELEGKRLVVLAELHRLNRSGNTLVAVHKDINNVDETVVFPKIKTTATDKKDGGKDIFAGEKQTVKDKVSYFNLIIGRVYKVMGRLVDEETGEPILDNGKEVTEEKEFTAMQSNGFVELEFTFNARALAGKTVVVFEDMYQDKIKIATHTDITDKEQSIYIPRITTKLTRKDSEQKIFYPTEKIRVKDTMQYENFVKGKVYYAKGEIVNDKTGKVIQRSEGNFIADERNGKASLDFTINAKGLEGARLVCFEEIYTIDENGNPDKLVAIHKDINDENQSVYIPKIKTKLTGKYSDEKVFYPDEKINLKDTMEYESFIKGKTYYAKGEIVNDKTGKVIKRSEGTFVADKRNGKTSLDFTINGKGLEGARLVCFEEIYTVDENGNPDKLIAIHKDINDEGQSVRIVKKPTPKTGDKGNMMYYVLGLLAAGGTVTYIRVKRAKK